jgi:hypothetical protein
VEATTVVADVKNDLSIATRDLEFSVPRSSVFCHIREQLSADCQQEPVTHAFCLGIHIQGHGELAQTALAPGYRI